MDISYIGKNLDNDLGIHDGHNGGATILQDGQIKYSISEERLTRKNECGYL